MEVGYLNMSKKSNWETSNSPYKEDTGHEEQYTYEEARDGPVEATPELDQAPDNDTMLELMSMFEEMNI